MLDQFGNPANGTCDNWHTRCHRLHQTYRNSFAHAAWRHDALQGEDIGLGHEFENSMARLPAEELHALLNSQFAHLPFEQWTVFAFADQKTTKFHTAPTQLGARFDEVSLPFMFFQAGNAKNRERLIRPWKHFEA